MSCNEKEIVMKIYEAIVQKAFSSNACSTISRLYPEAFYKESKLEKHTTFSRIKEPHEVPKL